MIALIVAVLLQAAPTYDALVARGLAQAREGRTEAAAETLERAIALDPRRAEARIERAGLRFLQRRYDDAIDDLQDALELKDDPYARDLLAGTYLLTGRNDPAIAEWNRLGKPTLGKVRIVGLRHADERAVRRELAMEEGRRLEIDDYRNTRVRLEETGFFDSVEMRPLVTAPGKVDLEVAVLERHGFGSIPELAVRGAVDLTRRKVRLRYVNLRGGITLGGEYKWEETQPFIGFTVDAFRPLGFPGMVSLEGLRSRPSYDFGEGPFRMRAKGGGVRGRVVVATRTVVEAGLRYRDRTFDVDRPDTPDGRIVGLEAGVDHTFWAGRRHDLVGSIRTVSAPRALGSDVSFGRVTGRVVHHLHVQRPDGIPIEHGSIAAQVILGYGTDATPLDEMFAPGAASEMDLPLRAHRQKSGGVLGIAPISRSIALVNFEWRQRLWRAPIAQVGYVLFYDGGRMGRVQPKSDVTLHDVGVGVRIGLRGAALLRLDHAWSLTDGKKSLTAGIGQVF